MAREETEELVPVAEEALRLGCSREQLVRRIQRRLVAGKLVDGRWYVDRTSQPDGPAAA